MEYIECIGSSTEDFTVGKIYEGFPEIITDSKRLVDVCSMDGRLWKFKPSTKEAYEAQNKPKSLVGRYLKALVDNAQNTNYKKGEYAKIKRELIGFIECTVHLESSFSAHPYNTKSWKLMPEGFDPNQVCEDCNGDGQVLKAKLYPTGHTEVNETCDKCRGDGFIEKEPTNNPTVLGVELVKGEYYVVAVFNQRWIFNFDIVDIDNSLYCDSAICLTGNQFYIGGNLLKIKDITSISKANFSERLWLDKCIAAGKFIPKEEALKEKEFVLPEKWCIKISKENIGICQKHNVLNKYYNYDYTIGAYYGNKMGGDYKIPENTTEITFEQFKKYVLKEETKPVIETIAEFKGLSVFNNHLIPELLNKKSDLEFQEPVIIKSIKNKPKLIIINN